MQGDFDTSFLVPLILPEKTSNRIAAFIRELPAEIYSLDKTMLRAGTMLGLSVRLGVQTK